MPRAIDAQPPVVLVPVVEVEPYRYSKLALPSDAGTANDWAEYFERCMADAGFRNVVPIAPRSNFVVARSLVGNPLLERMIEEALHEAGFPVDGALADREPFEALLPFSGGLALTAAGELFFGPGCCGDLHDLRGWKDALDAAPQPATVWIGHPAVELEFTADRVLLREGSEPQSPPEALVEASMPLVWLRSALNLAHGEQRRFRDDLVATVSRILGSADLAHDVASRLAGLA